MMFLYLEGSFPIGIQSYSQMMIGVFVFTSKPERYLASMKPFSVLVSKDP